MNAAILPPPYDRACKGCIYLGKTGNRSTCDYILITKKQRPCPPGEGCTVKTRRKDRMAGKKREWDTGRARQLLEVERLGTVEVADMVGATVSALLSWIRAENIKLQEDQRTDKKTAAPPPQAEKDTPREPTVKADEAFEVDELLEGPEPRPVVLNFALNQLELRLCAPSMEGAVKLLESVLNIVREGID